MINLLRLRITTIWLLLVAATCLSWGSARGHTDPRLATVAVLMIAFVKVRFVMLDFMEVRNAPLPLRLFCETWVVLVCAALIGLYWTGGVYR